MPQILSFPNGTTQSSGEWLTARMTANDVNNTELFRRLRYHGFRGGSSNIISLWKHDKTPISLDTLPFLLKALGMKGHEIRLWSHCFLRAEHPKLWTLVEEAA